MINENALSAKIMTDEIIVNRLNLKAGIEEFVSHKKVDVQNEHFDISVLK